MKVSWLKYPLIWGVVFLAIFLGFKFWSGESQDLELYVFEVVMSFVIALGIWIVVWKNVWMITKSQKMFIMLLLAFSFIGFLVYFALFGEFDDGVDMGTSADVVRVFFAGCFTILLFLLLGILLHREETGSWEWKIEAALTGKAYTFLFIMILVFLQVWAHIPPFYLYREVEMFDKFMHLLAGFTITLIIVSYPLKKSLWWKILIFTIAFVIIAVVWELIEIAIAPYERYDSVEDFIADCIRAVIAIIFLQIRKMMIKSGKSKPWFQEKPTPTTTT